MTNVWTPQDTTTHQDHVIAHVIGTSFLGYFVFEEALHVLLDIGFIWTIFLDGEMGLLPHPVAIGELEIGVAHQQEIKTDVELLLGNWSPEKLARLTSVSCQIKDVSFFAGDECRRLVITGEQGDISIEMSLATAEILVKSFLID
ncbi:MAG: hypothetical protein ABJC10_07685 [Acidobacteriota bacterium]